MKTHFDPAILGAGHFIPGFERLGRAFTPGVSRDHAFHHAQVDQRLLDYVGPLPTEAKVTRFLSDSIGISYNCDCRSIVLMQ